MLSANPPAEPSDQVPLFGRLIRRLRSLGRARFAIGYGLAAILTVLAVSLTSAAPGSGPIGPASRIVLALLIANFLLILGLVAVMAWRVWTLVAQSKDAGSRLHLRFVALFAAAAVAPAVIVAIFFGLLVNQGVDNWFNLRVRTAVENGAAFANAYLNEQQRYIQSEMGGLASDLNAVANRLTESPVAYSNYLQAQATFRAFPAVYVIDHQGRILARAESPNAPPYLAPPPQTMNAADQGEIVMRPFASENLFRAVYRLKGYDDAYLYTARYVERGLMQRLFQSSQSVIDYRDAESNRSRVKTVFALSYGQTVLLVLVGAVWLGMTAASAISSPIGALVQAADRVAGGDLSARVTLGKAPIEIEVLSQAFNRMTKDLGDQQAALRDASLDAETRRQFIETVLSGVSAGVVGLDASGAISAANLHAMQLLELDPTDGLGQALDAAAPEFLPVRANALERMGEAEAEIDLQRSTQTLRLRVRAASLPEGGMVLTFDDITRLVAAQRNAAWRDVARRIAHEIKNPLTPIQLSAERIRRKYRSEITSDLETFDRCTETIIRQVGDIGRMVDEFSGFARMPAPQFAQCDATELLSQAVFAQRVADPDTAIALQSPPGPVPLTCDSRMIGQSLTNLLKNAGEAIAARRQDEPSLAGKITARLVVEAGGLSFEIEDNGIGLPPKDRDRLTEPYVTTREKGTGLGLAIVKRIMEEHGGQLVLSDAAQMPGACTRLRFVVTDA
jgi:two-component system nitrogen regulation sensor histidine kinase NtrY